MAQRTGNRPAEIFGYPIGNYSKEARDVREKRWCPFAGRRCAKNSSLIDLPFGVCSVEQRGAFHAICPHRLEEQGSIADVPKALEQVAKHYFDSLDNTVSFPEVKLPNVGSIDYVLVRHKPMKVEVEDFVSVELQSDSTTGTGQVVQGLRDFFQGQDVREQTYRFGLNTYDTIKRAMTQLMNKGIVYESWGTKCYWVFQEHIYANLVNRYGFKEDGFVPEHASRFALYNLVHENDRLTLVPTRFISTTVEEVYHAMRNNPALPDKDKFVQRLNAKLKVRLGLQFN